MTLAEREKHAKQFVNGLRKSVGLRALAKLKRGIPLHPKCCPIAESLYDAGVMQVWHLDPCVILWGPDKDLMPKSRAIKDREVVRFMRDFDKGKYPHLEIPKTPIKIKYPGDRKATVIE